MTQPGGIGPIVERVVGQVLDSHIAQLRAEIARRVMEEIASAGLDATASPNFAANDGLSSGTRRNNSAADPANLARAIAEIQSGTSQREILRALLDTGSRHAARVALFVVKGNRATGWQARGFADSDAVKDFALEEATPAVVCAIRDRVVTGATVADMDSRFLQQMGMPANSEVQILPLILKDKVAAIVYADRGSDPAGLLDVSSLQLLVLSTNAWLEVNSLRKQAQKEPLTGQAESVGGTAEVAERTPVPAAPPFNDPFASHTPAFSPGRAMAAAASAGGSPLSVVSEVMPAPAMEASSVAEVSPAAATPAPRVTAHGLFAEVRSAEVQSVMAEAEPAHFASPYAEPAPAPLHGQAETDLPPSVPPPALLSPEDQEVHRKAARFARLLVDEIKLYNQAKLAEGRQCKDLYDRLKDVIEKSRATYQKRYGNTVAAPENYFEHEIISSLAEDDLSIMGANFRP